MKRDGRGKTHQCMTRSIQGLTDLSDPAWGEELGWQKHCQTGRLGEWKTGKMKGVVEIV